MFVSKLFIVLSTVVVFGDADFVNTLKKCSLKDNDCQRSTLQNVLNTYGKTGIPDYNVPSFDPVTLKDISLPLPNVVNITLVDGNLRGLSGCTVNKFNADIDSKHILVDITCDLILRGHYKAISEGQLIKTLLGGDSLIGDGKMKVKIDKFNIKFDVNFDIKKINGDFYLKGKDDKLKYKYDVLGKVQFAANNLLLDGQDVSGQIIGLLNQSWRLIVRTVGDSLVQRTIEPARNLIRNIFDNVPTKYYLIEDVTPYVS